MRRKPIILGDFKEVDEKLEKGLITQSEYQKIFEKSRFHGLDSSIFPFAVGGSDAPIIHGVSKYKSRKLLYYIKTGQYVEEISSDQKKLFFMGHTLEAPYRDIFTERTGLKTMPCSLQARHPDFPHLVANIDGLVIDSNGELGIYEGKTTYPFTNVAKCLEEGIAPLDYEYQVRFYMEVWDLDFAYIHGGWGPDMNKHFGHVRIERDPIIGRQICEECEHFVELAIKGIIPDSSNTLYPEVIVKDAEKIFGNADPSLPPVKLGTEYASTFKGLEELENELESLNQKIKPYQDEIRNIEKKYIDEKNRIKEIETRKQAILSIFPEVLGKSFKGELRTKDGAWEVSYVPSGKPCFDKDVKTYWKNNYPKCYEDVINHKPQKRTLAWRKIE